MLKAASCGAGQLALMAWCREVAASYQNPLAARPPHYTPRAKRMIFLFMNGGPSHVDTFDYKPQLTIDHGKPGRRKGRTLLKSPWKFRQHGDGGLWISELLPELARQADQLCVIRSMHTDSSAHPLAIPLLHTGSFQFTRPSIGAWVLYGLGSENPDLPGYITVNPTRVFGGPSNYGSAFLPTAYQATRIGWAGRTMKEARIHNLDNQLLSDALQQEQLKLIQSMNRRIAKRSGAEAEVAGVTDSFRLSARMQGVVPKLMDFSSESQQTLDRYGIGEKETDRFGRQCLLARRFAEAGVRFVQLSHGGWDHHFNLPDLVPKCRQVDRPIAALLTDLKQRGLLDDTLVMWAGEFGRQPEIQVDPKKKGVGGRDHNAGGYTVWLAGGGVRGGYDHGETDEHGFDAVVDKVHLSDLHATVLHLLGLDHKRLTYRYSGRDFRLTNVSGRVVDAVVG